MLIFKLQVLLTVVLGQIQQYKTRKITKASGKDVRQNTKAETLNERLSKKKPD